jgi:N-methylhydantoinase A/oxoprolinase/acetone carboxylase beta subunit
MGVQALLSPSKRAISLDIGGTTTDIAFWAEGAPLFSRRGAMINGYPTAARSLHISSLPVGGDSLLTRAGDGGITVGPERIGAAVALGGTHPTVTDAFLCLGLDDFGDRGKAIEAMRRLARPGEDAAAAAAAALDKAAEMIEAAIRAMIAEYARQPVYRVEDMVNAREFAPEIIIGAGGAARGLAPVLARRMGLAFDIPSYALIANAVGAAVARPAITADLRADTAAGRAIIPQAGRELSVDDSFSAEDGERVLTEWLREEARRLGVEFYGTSVAWREEFPVIRGGWRSGQIINLSVQLTPGIIFPVKGG